LRWRPRPEPASAAAPTKKATRTNTPRPQQTPSRRLWTEFCSQKVTSFWTPISVAKVASYLRRPPPPPPRPPPPRDPMLEAPRLPLARALDPLYPLDPPPKASRFPPPLRERSRFPIRSAPPPARLLAPPPAARLLTPPPVARLLAPAPPRLLARLPPCLPTCWRALAWRLESESPRVVPPNLSAVARSR